MFPFIAWFILRSGVARTASRIVVCWLGLLIVRALVTYWFPDPTAYSVGWWFVYISPFFRLTGFVNGMLVGYLFLLKKNAFEKSCLHPLWWTLFEAATLLLLVPLTWQLKRYVPHSFMYGPQFAPLIAVALIVFGMQSGWISRALSFRPLVHLGEISYSIYMTHIIVFEWAGRFLNSEFFGYNTHPWHIMAQCGLVLIVLAFSDILYRYLEHPCRDWMSKRVSAREHNEKKASSISVA
jgi:peptidoglycan/LPS O-acetylase OafA/YrhL